MRRMWIQAGDRRWLGCYVESGVAGLVLLRHRPGIWRVTHKASTCGMGPSCGLDKARKLARELGTFTDWTQPADVISANVNRTGAPREPDEWQEPGDLERRIRARLWDWDHRSPRRRGLSARLRRRSHNRRPRG